MSEEIKMTEENKKTIVAFVAGLLIGGLLVFVFSAPTEDSAMMNDDDRSDKQEQSESMTDDSTESDDVMEVEANGGTGAPALMIGEGSIAVADQGAGETVLLGPVTFPAESGWIGVRDYENGQLTGLLGVARWNQEEGLVPVVVDLLRPTEAGMTYAVVFYSDNGDKEFNLATDVQLDGAMSTFVAR